MDNSMIPLSALFFTLCITSSFKADGRKIGRPNSGELNIQDAVTTVASDVYPEYFPQLPEGSESVISIGPPFPVTGSWFMDRFEMEQWNKTLSAFKAQGGDTVILRAPSIVQRTKEDLARDPNFKWCGSYKSSSGNTGIRCYDEAVAEMTAMGHNVTAFLTYQYEEGFSNSIMLCPKYDRKINSSRTYYRIVLPTDPTLASTQDPCNFPPGSDVVVLFTSFSGTDPHQLLLQTAQSLNIAVFFGLPAAPYGFQTNLMPAYFAWVRRVLNEHKTRFAKMPASTSAHENVNDGHSEIPKQDNQNSLYNSLVGYYSSDECNLGDSKSVTVSSNLYKQLGMFIKPYGKHFAISPYINLNKSQQKSTVAQHVDGFIRLAKTGAVDIIAVQEGRGAGKGSYFWSHQNDQIIAQSDPVLDRIIHYLDPKLKVNVTFKEVFTASNQELFGALQRAHDDLLTSEKFDFWLNVQAFEYLRDNPCLPIDRMASGMGELLDRTSKERIDRALSIAGAKVQKIVSFAWDSDYTCATEETNSSLHTEIMSDLNRPIIANCSFHSPHNLSVVLLGFSLEGMTQAYTVEWTDTRGNQRASKVYGYYFELDYGIAHHLVDSLQYVMLWDISQMVQSLAPVGTVNVSASNAYEPCSFEYDLPFSKRNY